METIHFDKNPLPPEVEIRIARYRPKANGSPTVTFINPTATPLYLLARPNPTTTTTPPVSATLPDGLVPVHQYVQGKLLRWSQDAAHPNGAWTERGKSLVSFSVGREWLATTTDDKVAMIDVRNQWQIRMPRPANVKIPDPQTVSVSLLYNEVYS
jgi:hypothetical protein